MYSLEFYETSSGNSQVRDFLSNMSGKGKAKFFQIANLLKEAGPEVRMPYSRYLDDGIFEVRVMIHPASYISSWKDKKEYLQMDSSRKPRRRPERRLKQQSDTERTT